MMCLLMKTVTEFSVWWTVTLVLSARLPCMNRLPPPFLWVCLRIDWLIALSPANHNDLPEDHWIEYKIATTWSPQLAYDFCKQKRKALSQTVYSRLPQDHRTEYTIATMWPPYFTDDFCKQKEKHSDAWWIVCNCKINKQWELIALEQLTSHVERRPSTTETQVTYDNST